MDIDQICEVIIKAFENNYLAENMVPGSDLVHHNAAPGFLETNRNSNFKSSFRPLTGEKNDYSQYSLDKIRNQEPAMGKRRRLDLFDSIFMELTERTFLLELNLSKIYVIS